MMVLASVLWFMAAKYLAADSSAAEASDAAAVR
jgi:hypothetical protein